MPHTCRADPPSSAYCLRLPRKRMPGDAPVPHFPSPTPATPNARSARDSPRPPRKRTPTFAYRPHPRQFSTPAKRSAFPQFPRPAAKPSPRPAGQLRRKSQWRGASTPARAWHLANERRNALRTRPRRHSAPQFLTRTLRYATGKRKV